MSESSRIVIIIEAEDLEWINKAAKIDDRSRSAFVRRAAVDRAKQIVEASK